MVSKTDLVQIACETNGRDAAKVDVLELVVPKMTTISTDHYLKRRFFIDAAWHSISRIFRLESQCSAQDQPGQSLKITHSRRLIRPPQNVVRRPLVTQIHISTTPVRSTQLASAEFRPSQRAAIVPPKAFDPLSGSDNTNRFPSPTQSQTIPAPPNSFRQIQVSPALPPPAQTRISASTSPMVSAQDALARTNQSFVGQFAPAPSPLSATPLSSVVNAQPMSSPTSQPSVASQMQFRGVSSTPQQFLPAGAPNRGRSIAAPQKPISAKTRVVPQAPVAPLLPVIPLQIQRPQLLPQPVPQLPSVPATASPVQRPQIPLVPAVPIRQPAVSMQRQPLFAPRPGPEASVVQRTQAVTQPTPQRPQILPNEELIQDQLQIKHNSVGGEQELGPTPPAPQLAARPPAVGVGGDSAPGFLPPNDFVVNTLNAADDFMSVADSMQLRKRFKGDRRRRRQAESRASQLKLANSYS
ncbi:unnamed protein product [Toxocara canis]|uniref:BZIP domain-containing protein n=1 Tax=Toxocara canis TaxID=6265 RepID=A0A183UK78_TOXCA|nr:unnamed protein product [Toxocara canis]